MGLNMALHLTISHLNNLGYQGNNISLLSSELALPAFVDIYLMGAN